MQRLMLAFDGSGAALRALRHAVALAGANPPVELHLVNAQERPPLFGEIGIYVEPDRLTELLKRESAQVLAAGEAVLQQAGLRYTAESLFGPVAETLVRRADELGCTGIVMGTRGMGAVGNLLLGSVATKVVHLTRLPVTLVK